MTEEVCLRMFSVAEEGKNLSFRGFSKTLSIFQKSTRDSHLTGVTVNREENKFKDKFLHVYNIFVNMY